MVPHPKLPEVFGKVLRDIEELIKAKTPIEQWTEHQDLLRKTEENINKQKEKLGLFQYRVRVIGGSMWN